jgi:hypothetical protein
MLVEPGLIGVARTHAFCDGSMFDQHAVIRCAEELIAWIPIRIRRSQFNSIRQNRILGGVNNRAVEFGLVR